MREFISIDEIRFWCCAHQAFHDAEHRFRIMKCRLAVPQNPMADPRRRAPTVSGGRLLALRRRPWPWKGPGTQFYAQVRTDGLAAFHRSNASRKTPGDRAQMTTTTKLDLTNFRKLDPLDKLKQAKRLVDAGNGVLRLEKRGGVLYLRERSTFQFLVEKLVLFPKEIRAREMDARKAINEHIMPFLSEDALIARVHMAGDQTPLIDNLHRRVFSTKKSPEREKRRNSEAPENFAACTRTMINDMTTVPLGLSVARVSPSKVVADLRIIATEELFNQRPYEWSGLNDRLDDYNNWAKKECSASKNNGIRLVKYYEGTLAPWKGMGHKTIVLEVLKDDEAHWKSAYTASRDFIKDRKLHQQTVSIMLVPRCSPQPGEDTKNEKESDKDWLDRMRKIMDAVELKGKKSTAPVVATPDTRRQAFLGVEND